MVSDRLYILFLFLITKISITLCMLFPIVWALISTNSLSIQDPQKERRATALFHLGKVLTALSSHMAPKKNILLGTSPTINKLLQKKISLAILGSGQGEEIIFLLLCQTRDIHVSFQINREYNSGVESWFWHWRNCFLSRISEIVHGLCFCSLLSLYYQNE